jgi:hypothetical protein
MGSCFQDFAAAAGCWRCCPSENRANLSCRDRPPRSRRFVHVESSLRDHEEWLSFLGEIRDELSCVTAAGVLHRVNCPVRDEQGLAGSKRHWRPPIEVVLQQTFDDVDEFFAWMPVPGSCRSRGIPTSA